MKSIFFLMLGLSAGVAAQSVPMALLPAENGTELTPEKAQLAAGAQKTDVTAPVVSADKGWSGYAQVQKTAENGNPQEALRQLNRRLSGQPDDSKAAYLKGLILMQLGQSEQAERWFKMMQANFPDLPQPDNALAVIYGSRGDLQAAEQVLRDLLSKQPAHFSAHLNLAKIYTQLAAQEYEKALKAKPDDAMIAGRLKALQTLR